MQINSQEELFALTNSFTSPNATKPVKEELDATSSTDEFIISVAKAIASFIKQNRNAFDLDDSIAIDEFAKVSSVDAVKENILKFMQEVEEVPPESAAPAQPEEDAEAKKAHDEEFVSEDVMKILDE